MKKKSLSASWEPLSPTDRLSELDVLRGVALVGVLLVNLLTVFRVSLFNHILAFHTNPGWGNHLVDILAAWLLEFKAFTLFSFLFGVGVGIQTERARMHTISPMCFLAGRFGLLLAFGLCHMLLIWNGDILALYGVCGLLLLPFLERSVTLIVAIGISSILLFYVPGIEIPFPSEASMHSQAVIATHIYQEGSFPVIMVFRWVETWQFITPLLISSLPKTLGLMLLGIASWRTGIFKKPVEHRRLLIAILIGAGFLGGVATTLLVWSESTGQKPMVWPVLLQVFSHIPLAFALGAGLLLWLGSTVLGPVSRLFAAAGKMALTNYVMQSIIFSVLFYGYGFGLFGRLGSAETVLIGVLVYAGQLIMSRLWLQHFRFGPAEWLWRSLSYGRIQPMKGGSSANQTGTKSV
jgi:uncharacterized protein